MKNQLLSIAWITLFTLAITSPSHAIPTIWESNFGANLGLGDDTTTGVSFGFSYDFLGAPFTGATVSSNGFIRLAPSSSSLCCDANVGTFLSGAPMIAAAWFDIRPPIVFYNTFAGRAVVTWEAPEFSSSTVNRYQAQLF